MTSFLPALKKAVATFLFSTIGVIVGNSVLGIDAATWKLALSTGLGALLNLVYRWAEKAKDA